MRINNKRINIYIETIYILFLLGIFCSLMLVFIPISVITKFISPYFLLIGFMAGIYLLQKLGHQHMEFSSEGEVLNIKTQDVFWTKYFPSTRIIVDFPKSKLVNFKIQSGIFQKKLDLYITSKRSQNGIAKLSFNITYLNKSEINDLKRSLNKILKKNGNLEEENLKVLPA
jgi:uncharacterized membrane protein YdbT with pleckstrin-like domain